MSIEPLDWVPPQLGAAVDINGDIRWIRLPVPGSLQHINVWLVPGQHGRVLVDTGMNLPDTHAAWEVLALSERLAQELRGILVTHHHPDHFGMAARLAARFNVPVRMSAPARAAAQHSVASDLGATDGSLTEYRREWGVDFAALLERARAAGVFGKLISGIPPQAPPVVEGERIAELREPWQASLHFGHAEGHVCLHWAQGQLLISGDQLLPTISSNISLYPGAGSADPLADFLVSLERLARLPDETIVLPAHGQPFRGAAARAAQLKAGHQRRLAQLSQYCAAPRSTPELVAELFGARNLEGWNSLLAYGETLAHVRYLHARGKLTRLAGEDTVHWVRAA
jgi:glyoxylase-like metal-dependent hydrolase (beta-lactamase superfamily II)